MNERDTFAATRAPVVWAVVSDSKEEIDCEFVYPDEATAGDVALDINGGVVPLYRSPTLTDAEREAIEVAAHWCQTPIDPVYSQTSLAAQLAADTLRGLLERTK